ncbi:MAG TPA: hypothetical protein PK202_13930 [Verrucomicrobiota bacterium]|nr:MAG: hypothetical protein BWX68_02177 [Verrucomicrobia bacterium ADurb.Bin063]HNW08043.1 hypothetical protein [Verrucomicrobiota bacterium]HOX63401.1 hypothetical protein [Verrucomicrobiota bacterium]HPI66390.1 hypothetical protein [Verrucomicrobiota bacterium]HPW92705.1 hypothetical protein [Verrucomicrobiota bacterium]
MNLNQHNPNSLRRFAIFALLFLLGIAPALAKPRLPAPPWPEIGNLFCESFDQPYSFPTNQTIDSAVWAESWSGYSLVRSRPPVQPFTVPMVNPGTNRTLNLDPERGAIRIWYQPAWSGGWTGQGTGPGDLARLLTLVSTNRRASAEWWSMVITPDGNELHVVCETETGPVSCLSTLINWEAGSWHMLAVGYTPTNSALIVDGQVVATGNGLPSLPLEAMPHTTLVIGSDLAGRNTAKGQFELLSTFTGRNRFRSISGHPFGMGNVWDVEYYYAAYSPEAAKGPVTPEEEAATRARWAALRAERIAQQQAALLSGASSRVGLEGGFELDSYDSEQGFRLLTPEIQQQTNVFLTLVNCDTNIGYDIYYTPAITTNMTWSILATGHIGQTTFTVPRLGWMGFFRGAVGGDWDGDFIPNWMDADPRSTNTGALSITIDSPVNGTLFQ